MMVVIEAPTAQSPITSLLVKKEIIDNPHTVNSSKFFILLNLLL